MNDTNAQRCLDRFHAYAAAFETAYETNDWSVLTPHFTADATSEVNGNRATGRDAVIASLRDGVAMFDRRFDSRTHRFVEGPEIRDGQVHIKTAAIYARDGIEPLELIGEEWFTFEDGRIAGHVDNVVNFTEVMTYLGNHAGDLLPFVPYTEPHATSVSAAASR